MEHFIFTQQDVDNLIKIEPKFKPFIDLDFGTKTINPNVFESIIESMIAQQISGRVAGIITNRLKEKVKVITPQKMLKLTDDEYKEIGLGPQKRGYIRSISNSVKNKDIDLNKLQILTSEEVIEQLTKLKGVGSWTAEMLLIFSLGRRDVLSIKDLGIKKGIAYLYGFNSHKDLSDEFLIKTHNKLKSVGTLASFYFWELSTLTK